MPEEITEIDSFQKIKDIIDQLSSQLTTDVILDVPFFQEHYLEGSVIRVPGVEQFRLDHPELFN